MVSGALKIDRDPKVHEAELNQVIELMITGCSEEEINRHLVEQFPGSDHKALLIAAGNHFLALAKADQSVLFGWCLDATRNVYALMLKDGDLAGALKAIKQLRDFTK